MQKITDFDCLWERFSIMTVDGKLTDQRAIELLKTRTTQQLIEKLKQKVIEITIG